MMQTDPRHPLLKITFWRGVYAADHRPGDETLLKKAGFQLHEPTMCTPSVCRACRAGVGRRYWTYQVESATRLHKYCLPKAIEAMGPHLRKLASSRAVDSSIVVPAPPNMVYKPFQRAGIAYAIVRKTTMFGDDMGLGKTVEALGFINYVRARKVLVVAPATLPLNWMAEAQKWLVDDFDYFIPDNSKDMVPETDRPLMVITNYEKISGTRPRRQMVALDKILCTESRRSSLLAASREYLTFLADACEETADLIPVLVPHSTISGKLLPVSGVDQVEACRALGREKTRAIILPPETLNEDLDVHEARKTLRDTPLSASLRRRWDVAIFDEAQALKNPGSQRSVAALGPEGLHECSKRSLFLSGTPMENNPKEIWPIAAAVCPSKFGDWWNFARRYCGLHSEERKGKTVWVADGCTNPFELQQKLRTTFMIRRLKEDVLKELPPKRRQLIVLDEKIDWSQYPEFERWRELYERAYDEALAKLEVARTEEEYRLAAKKLSTITVPFTEASDLRHKTALLKLPGCLRYTDEILAAGIDCVVIYAHHRDVLSKIHEHYGEQSCVIYGETKKKDRMPIVQAFQEGKKKVFIGGLRAAGMGITLTRASTVIFFETDWNPATMAQAEDRLCRIGQKKMVHVIHPVLDGSLDANMIKKILSKKEAVYRVLDKLAA